MPRRGHHQSAANAVVTAGWRRHKAYLRVRVAREEEDLFAEGGRDDPWGECRCDPSLLGRPPAACVRRKDALEVVAVACREQHWVGRVERRARRQLEARAEAGRDDIALLDLEEPVGRHALAVQPGRMRGRFPELAVAHEEPVPVVHQEAALRRAEEVRVLMGGRGEEHLGLGSRQRDLPGAGAGAMEE